MISPRTGQWKAVKYNSGQVDVLADGDIDTLSPLHETDLLRVDAVGSEFLFSINGREITHLEDSDFAGGLTFIMILYW